MSHFPLPRWFPVRALSSVLLIAGLSYSCDGRIEGTDTLRLAIGTGSSITVGIGEEAQLSAAPVDASGHAYLELFVMKWESSKPEVLKVTGAGAAKGVTLGQAEVKVTATRSSDGSVLSGTISVAVIDPAVGVITPIPGTLRAQDYRAGGEGTGYHDLTGGNAFGGCTADDVDKKPVADGTCVIGQFAGGEWLSYHLDVATAGTYAVTAHVARGITGASHFHLELDGINVTGNIDAPATGSWDTFTDVSSALTTSAGRHILRLVNDGDWLDISRLVFTATTTNRPPPSVSLTPGQNIQSALDAAPAGAIIQLEAGTHRIATALSLKNNQVLQGAPGAILSGGRLLTQFTASGSTWYAGGQTQEGYVHGDCEQGHPRCNRPEDLYIDRVRLEHVGSLGEVGAGKWFFDYDADRIYLPINPNGHTVETTVTSVGIGGTATGVTIRGLIVEMFANRAQMGAIQGDDSNLWTLENNEIRFNHGAGVRSGNGMVLRGNDVHHNGQIGVGGGGDNILFEGNSISYNNVAAYQWGWEGGGTKFCATHNLVVRNNWSHHNFGPGLWTDIDNIFTLYEGNTVEDNLAMGIFHEISYDAVIRNNISRRNGFGNADWLWGAGILVAGSGGVGTGIIDVHHNTVTDNADGISLIQQNRGSGPYGPHLVRNVSVHHNTVSFTNGQTGAVQDIGDNAIFTSANNSFQANTYTVPANSFVWGNQAVSFSSWQGSGQDTQGSVAR